MQGRRTGCDSKHILFGSAAWLVAVMFAGIGVGSVARGGVILTTTADAATLGPDGNFASAAAGPGTSVANTTLATGRAGSNSTTPSGRAYVIPFLLPTLPTGSTFSSASFTVYEAATNGAGGSVGTYPNGTNANFDADLYGLAARSSSAVQASDYFQGSLDATPGTTLIEDNIATPSTTTVADATPLTTNAVGSAALAAYLNAQYATAGPGSYVFLRLSADGDSGLDSNIAYNFYTFDQGTVNGQSVIPSITYSTSESSVPEPASAGLTAIAAFGLLARRRVPADR